MSALPLPPRRAFFHVDMDGLDAIFRGHGQAPPAGPDRFYTSAVEGSLALFAEAGVTATYFLIAQDLDDPHKRPAIDAVVRAGHRIASHSLAHRYLDRIPSAEKRVEIVTGRDMIQQTLGVACEGFRAPGYSIDYESLTLLREAGFTYDSSIFPTYAFRTRLGLQRLYPEPFALWPGERPLFEMPLPAPGPGLPPWHPCYAFELGAWYFRRGVDAFAKEHRYLTVLFHLTDFAAPQPIGGGRRLRLFTNNGRSQAAKLAFLRRLVAHVQRDFTVSSTEAFLAGWPASAPDLNPRTILGISTTHETGACVVRDGVLLSAVSEERMSRVKLDNRYPPKDAIREAIRLAGVAPGEVDAVAVAGLHWKDLLPQTWDSFRRDVKDYHALNDYLPHFVRVAYRLYYLWRAIGYGRVRDFLFAEYGIRPKLFHVEHHEAHAASAFRTGPADDALVITADGVGDDVCITLSRGTGPVLRRLATYFYPHSLGQFYTACTQVLGFKGGRHEGKITGLAGFGREDPELMRKVEGTLLNGDGGFRLHKKYYAEGFVRLRLSDLGRLVRGTFGALTVDYRNYKPPLKRLLRGYPRENVAYAFQALLERELVRITRPHVEREGTRAIVLAGGVFANVKANMAVSEAFTPEALFIFPAMGDGGLCVGAALNVTAPRRREAPPMYLGTAYDAEQCRAALDAYPDLKVGRPADLAGAVAAEIAASRIVARFDGAMEFGPRALGNRSILYHGADRSVNTWLNKQLNRTEFMPFAPIGIYEDAAEYFHLREGERRPCEYMTLVVRCTEKMERECPAAVHVDGTARPQLLKRETNPGMYAILEAYKRRTGIAVMINTSFNMHEEPIIRSPDEAIRSFLQSRIHALVLGPYLVHQADDATVPA